MDKELIVIENVEDLENYLVNIQKVAKSSYRDILKAQLIVVKNISTPELVGTSLDTLFKSIKSALKQSKTEIEKKEIQEKGSLIIQNFVFFNRAKLSYIIDKNKKEAEQLFNDAGKMLANSVVDVTMNSVQGGFNPVTVGISIFSQAGKNPDLMLKIFNFFFKKNETGEKEKEFFEGLSLLFDKLGKHKRLIGESDIIAGMIDNYKLKLIEHKTSYLYEKSSNSYQLAHKSISKLKIYALIILGLSFVLLIIKFFWYQLSSFSISIMSLFSDENTEEVSNPWFQKHLIWTLIILAIVTIIQYVFYFNYKKHGKDYENSYELTKSDLLVHYNELSSSFQENY